MVKRAKNARIFVHEPHEGAALFGDILQQRGFLLHSVFTPEASPAEISADSDLLLVMGGPMGVYEADTHPFLHREIAALETRLAKGVPTLGICLGAQLMAKALGANVFKGRQGFEIGWSVLNILPAAKQHPVKHFSAAKTSMFHWHGDTFDLPPKAELLASTAQYANQAFSFGKNALALQCHPEVTAESLEPWYETVETGQDWKEVSMPRLRLETQQNIGMLNTQANLFLNEWLESVGL